MAFHHRLYAQLLRIMPKNLVQIRWLYTFCVASFRRGMVCICWLQHWWSQTKKFTKLECLVALCRALLHPQLINKFWVKKFWGEKIFWIFFPENKSCLKLPELPRSHISRGPATDRQPDGRHHRVTSRVAPCSSKVGQKKFKQNKFTRVNFSYWQCPSWE